MAKTTRSEVQDTSRHIKPVKGRYTDIPIDTLADTPAEHEAQTFCHISRNVEAETLINTLTDKLEEAERLGH